MTLGMPTLPPLKAIAYADDDCVYLSTPNDFYRIQAHHEDWIDQVRCNASTLLQLPMQALFANIPSDHWLQSRTKMQTQAYQFFIF
jgi:hypothetical protein